MNNIEILNLVTKNGLQDLIPKLAENKDAFSSFLEHADEFQAFLDLQEKTKLTSEDISQIVEDVEELETKSNMSLADIAALLLEGTTGGSTATQQPKAPRVPRQPREAREAKKPRSRDNAPDGPFWGEEGKPQNTAACKAQIVKHEKGTRKYNAIMKLLVEYQMEEPVSKKVEPKSEPKGTPNPNGIWGSEGKPETIPDCRKRLRDPDLKPRVKVMLDKRIEELRKEEVHPSAKSRKYGKTAAAKIHASIQQRRAARESTQDSPKRSVAHA